MVKTKRATKATKDPTKSKEPEHLRKKHVYGCKRGARSLEETDLLYTYVAQGKSVEEICELFNRNETAVNRWLEELHIKNSGGSPLDVKRILDNLKKFHFWPNVCNQFTENEVRYFEGEWISLMLQFREDVKGAELISLKQLVMINILINRSMSERKKHIEEIEKLEEEIKGAYDTGDDDRAQFLEQQVSLARSSLTSYTREYTDLLKEQKAIIKDLKMTRDQRIKKVEDSKSSWAGLLRLLEDKDYRMEVGRDAELMRIAKDKSKKEISEYLTYQDGDVDQPLLTPETVLEEEDNA